MSVAAPSPAAPGKSKPTSARTLAVLDRVFQLVCQAAACLVVVAAGLLVAILVERSWLAITTLGLSFLTQETWNPNAEPPVFGSLAFVYGTLATSAVAMVLALPLGVGTAAYLSEIASARFRRVASFFIEMLAAIPSVIYGFWGVFVLAPLVQGVFTFLGGPNTNGRGILSAGLVLSVMIVPYIAAISYDVCQAVPRSQREGSLALGATRWQTIWGVVLPYARPGILAGAFLALGRALGETMAVTMLIGNRDIIDLSPFAVGDSIASRLANQYMEADRDLFRSVLVELGLLLLAVTVAINTLARVLLARVGSHQRLLPSLPFRRQVPPPPSSAGAGPARAARRPLPRQPALLSAEAVNAVMTWVLWGCVVFTMSMLVVILSYLMLHGAGALNWSFFTELPVSPTVRRGTTVTVTLARPESLPGVQARLGTGPPLPGQELGPMTWVDDTQEARARGKPLPLRRDVEVFTPVLDAARAEAFVRGRLGDDAAAVAVEVSTGGGLANAIVGTIEVVGWATLFAVPVGLLAAIFLAEYRPGRLAQVVRFLTEQLAGVPSIVVGIFAAGLFSLVTDLLWQRFSVRVRFYGWSGVFALAVMMVPIVIRAAEEALKLVPQSLRNAAFALGASHAQTITKVTVPAALPAVITAVFLSIARIAGETAPLLLTAGFNTYYARSLNDFTPTLPPYIFKFATSPSPNWQRQAWAAAFLLMALVLLVNVGIRAAAGKRVVLASRAD